MWCLATDLRFVRRRWRARRARTEGAGYAEAVEHASVPARTTDGLSAALVSAHALQIEVNRALYVDEGLASTAGFASFQRDLERLFRARRGPTGRTPSRTECASISDSASSRIQFLQLDVAFYGYVRQASFH